MSVKKFSQDHEWIEMDGDIGTVGISGYAQEQLGEIVFVELPEVGANVAAKGQFAVVESVKAASEIYAPAGGEVVEVNGVLEDAPETINSGAETTGWIAKIRVADSGELDALLDDAAYREFVSGLED
jgi:glycine cleavage system H protein